MTEIKLAGINIIPELYKDWSFDDFVKAYGDAANYRSIPIEKKKAVLKADWADMQKHFPKKKKEEGESL